MAGRGGEERRRGWGLTGVEFASNSAVFQALQSKPPHTMREGWKKGDEPLHFRFNSLTQALAPVLWGEGKIL